MKSKLLYFIFFNLLISFSFYAQKKGVIKNVTDLTFRSTICINDSLRIVEPTSGKNIRLIRKTYGDNSIESPFIAFADGGIAYRSVDNGESWEGCKFPKDVIITTLIDVKFLNKDIGFVIGYNHMTKKSLILKTIDGGVSWNKKEEFDEVLLSIEINSSKNRVLVGGANLKIIKSDDSGETWTDVSSNISSSDFTVRDIKMLSEDKGIACAIGNNQTFICKTSDGGDTWTKSLLEIEAHNANWSNKTAKFRKIDVINENLLFMYDLDNTSAIVKSVDGGETFTLLDDNYWSLIYWIGGAHFVTETEGYIYGGSPSSSSDADKIFKTEDGGETWEEKNSGGNAVLFNMSFIDENNQIGFVNSNSGKLLRTEDGGDNWLEILPVDYNSNYYLYGVTALKNEETYYLYGNGADKGVLFINDNLIDLPLEQGEVFKNTFAAINKDLLFYHTDKHMYRSIDSGQSWNIVSSLDSYDHFYSMHSPENENVIFGFAYEFDDDDEFKLIKSVDKGVNWVEVSSWKNRHSIQVNFINNNVGFWLSLNGVLLKTTDGGVTISNLLHFGKEETYSQYHGQYKTINKYRGLSVVDDKNIFLAGNNGMIKKTINGGQTWKDIYSGIQLNFLGIKMFDENVGYAYGEFGIIMKTINGGENWEQIKTEFDEELRGTPIRDLTFVKSGDSSDDYRLAIVGGYSNTVFMLANHCYQSSLNIEEVNDFWVNQIKVYPNPSTNTVSIQSPFVIKKMKVYSLKGKELIVNDTQNNSLNISHLASGVYFLKIETEKGIGVRKIIKE